MRLSTKHNVMYKQDTCLCCGILGKLLGQFPYDMMNINIIIITHPMLQQIFSMSGNKFSVSI